MSPTTWAAFRRTGQGPRGPSLAGLVRRVPHVSSCGDVTWDSRPVFSVSGLDWGDGLWGFDRGYEGQFPSHRSEGPGWHHSRSPVWNLDRCFESLCRRRIASPLTSSSPGPWGLPGPHVRCVCDLHLPVRAPVGVDDPSPKGRPGNSQHSVRTPPAPSRSRPSRPPSAGRLPLRPLTTEGTPVRGRDGGAQTRSNEAEAAISSLPFSNIYVPVLPVSTFEGPGS